MLRLLRGRTVSSMQDFKVNHAGDKEVRLRGRRDTEENGWRGERMAFRHAV